MDESCKVAQDAAPMRDQSRRSEDIVTKILLQVIQCTYFVKDIAASGVSVCMDTHSDVLLSFNGVASGGRVLRDMVSLTDQQAKDYIDNFQRLRLNPSEHANITVAVMVHRVCGELQTIGKAILFFFFFSNQSLISRVEGLQLLNEVKFADKAYGDIKQPKARCLDGTRTEIIESILRWAIHADCPDLKEQIGRVPDPSARVLWLCGVAGSGNLESRAQ